MITLAAIRLADGLTEALQPLRHRLEDRLNLTRYTDGQKPFQLYNNMLQRVALMAGLSRPDERSLAEVEEVRLISRGDHVHDTTFSRNNLQPLWSALLKLRYEKFNPDWESAPLRSKIINAEMFRGIGYLLESEHLDEWLLHTVSPAGRGGTGSIPRLNLHVGSYDELPAYLDLNGRDIANNQILVAGTTGSGKSNLLAILMHELRAASVETAYPVNFLFFDYKGEFADPANRAWLTLFEATEAAILDPLRQPLPFTPFKNFEGRTQNEINLYATELAGALTAIDRASISAKMNSRLTEAVINAYRRTQGKPVDFELLEREYAALLEKDTDDSVRAVLKQLIRTPLFARQDSVDLIRESYFIKMDGFPKDGVLAKALVYFVVSKLNNLYESLPKQASNDECVELRHFTIIDEAHYMLDFDNRPLRNLIAVGRNKGLSLILATQNMDSFKSEHFDFFANAQYPLLMKQQSVNDKVLRDLFGASGAELQDIKEAIAGLQKGELLVKDTTTTAALGFGKKYKKMKVKHLI